MIHFRETGKPSQAKNYGQVQKSIFNSIHRHLDSEEFNVGPGPQAGALNFSLFISLRAEALMSHGVADKNYLLRKVKGAYHLNRFRHVLVPGEWFRKRLLAHPKLKYKGQIHSVGWPRLDELLTMQAAHVPVPSPRPRVLWAPTHGARKYGEEKVRLSSYPEFQDYLPELEKTCDVEVSLHPRNRKDKKPTSQKLIECDVVISDFGTLVYEAWALGKPVIFPSWILGDRMLQFLWKDSAEYQIYSQRIGLHAESFLQLQEFVHGNRSLDDKVLEFRDDYLDPKYTGVSGQRIADLLRHLAADVSQAGEAVSKDAGESQSETEPDEDEDADD